ncbi:MAG: RHS repeat protein, partial [Xanthomonadales bacterium]|nr:RHS repeat protein [Xanthomonadales bacterium]
QAIGSGTHEAPTGSVIMDYRYHYDAAGNITTRQTDDGDYQYGYDLIDRLTRATPPESIQRNPADPQPGTLPDEAYTYDPVHNRTSSQHQPGPWTYNEDNQLLNYGIGSDKHSFTYTANGHTETETTGDPATHTRTFSYNAAERLIEIKDNTQTIGQYRYDPMGRRIRKQTSEGITWFLYSDQGLIAELDGAGNPKRYYGWKPDGLWGTDPLWLADKHQATWQTQLYHNDHLWTPQRLTDSEGS